MYICLKGSGAAHIRQSPCRWLSRTPRQEPESGRESRLDAFWIFSTPDLHLKWASESNVIKKGIAFASEHKPFRDKERMKLSFIFVCRSLWLPRPWNNRWIRQFRWTDPSCCVRAPNWRRRRSRFSEHPHESGDIKDSPADLNRISRFWSSGDIFQVNVEHARDVFLQIGDRVFSVASVMTDIQAHADARVQILHVSQTSSASG